MKKLEASDESKASHFLEVVSSELRRRRWKIRDLFRDVDKAKTGALGEKSLAVEPFSRAASRISHNSSLEGDLVIVDVAVYEHVDQYSATCGTFGSRTIANVRSD